MGFVLDRSTSLGNRNFRRALKIIHGLVKAFDVKPGCSRAGLVTFADNATTDIDFEKYDSYKDFNKATRELKRVGK